MRDELIRFETAKLAKEKGFNILTYGSDYYIEYLEDEVFDDPRKGYEVTLNRKGDVICGKANYISVKYNKWLAPTQSLLKKWLREVHGYNLVVEHSKSHTVETFSNNSRKKIFDKWKISFDGKCYGENFNSYEEALEEGLHQVLVLIK